MSAIPSWRAGAAAAARASAPTPEASASTGVREDGRLGVHYVLTLARGEDAAHKAALIGLEQTVELPRALLTADLADRMAGRVEDVRLSGPRTARATLSYPVEAIGDDLPQCLNLLFGNISLKPGIRIVGIDWPAALLDAFGGPGHGVAGLRALTGARDRALLCTALKPIGLPARELAQRCEAFARGGIDIIKDDHGLTDQPFCPYRERVVACADAVARANAQTGKKSLYAPNITAPVLAIAERVRLAQDLGAGGLLVAPGLTGFDALRMLAADETVNLPLMSHPAWLGSLIVSPDSGVAHAVIFGQLQRLAGADASIYPNYGGRFAFSREECARIAEGCRMSMGRYPPIFPTPGGGMTLDRIPDLLALYGEDVLFLMGGGLYGRSLDLVDNARYFLSLVGR